MASREVVDLPGSHPPANVELLTQPMRLATPEWYRQGLHPASILDPPCRLAPLTFELVVRTLVPRTRFGWARVSLARRPFLDAPFIVLIPSRPFPDLHRGRPRPDLGGHGP